MIYVAPKPLSVHYDLCHCIVFYVSWKARFEFPFYGGAIEKRPSDMTMIKGLVCRSSSGSPLARSMGAELPGESAFVIKAEHATVLDNVAALFFTAPNVDAWL